MPWKIAVDRIMLPAQRVGEAAMVQALAVCVMEPGLIRLMRGQRAPLFMALRIRIALNAEAQACRNALLAGGREWSNNNFFS